MTISRSKTQLILFAIHPLIRKLPRRSKQLCGAGYASTSQVVSLVLLLIVLKVPRSCEITYPLCKGCPAGRYCQSPVGEPFSRPESCRDFLYQGCCSIEGGSLLISIGFELHLTFGSFKAAHRMTRFPPEPSVETTVKLTRTAYAQLVGQKFYPPKIFGQWTESEDTPAYKTKDLGMKIVSRLVLLNV